MVDNEQGMHPIHFEADNVIWEFMVPPAETASDWRRISGNFCPVRTFKRKGGEVSVSQAVTPSSNLNADRVMIRSPKGHDGKFSWFGWWNLDSVFIEQYCWKDEATLLQTSTGQLRKMQSAHKFTRHKALIKWENQLDTFIS